MASQEERVLDDISDLLANLDDDQINDFIKDFNAILRAERGRRAAKARVKFKPGDRVKFTGKSGIVHLGTVTKINQKSVNVDTQDGGRWRVNATALEKVA